MRAYVKIPILCLERGVYTEYFDPTRWNELGLKFQSIDNTHSGQKHLKTQTSLVVKPADMLRLRGVHVIYVQAGSVCTKPVMQNHDT